MSTEYKYIAYEYSITGTTGSWHDVRVEGDYFRRESVVTVTDIGESLGIWSTPVPIRFDGEDGYTPIKDTDYFDGISAPFTSIIYYRWPTKPLTPMDGSYANGFETLPTALEGGLWRNEAYYDGNNDYFIWQSTSRYVQQANGLWENGAWSTPVRFSGYNSNVPAPIAGVDGRFKSFIFTNYIDKPASPLGGDYTNSVETIPTGWTTGVTDRVGSEVTWTSSATYISVGGVWSKTTWSEVARFSAEDGYTPVKDTDYFDAQAGTYTSLVFANASTKPTTPTDGSYNGTSEIYPSGWFDDPTTPSSGVFIWVTRRKYVDDVGGWVGTTWSEPTKFSGEDGYTPIFGTDYTDGATGVFTSYVFQNKAAAPQVPQDSSNNGTYDGLNEVMPLDTEGGVWTDDPVSPAINETVWVMVARYIHDPSDNTWDKVGWSIPARFSGFDGTTGVDAPYLSDIYKVILDGSSVDLVLPTGGTYIVDVNGDLIETIPTGWTARASYGGVGVEYRSTVKYVNSKVPNTDPATVDDTPIISTWAQEGGWSAPAVFALTGEGNKWINVYPAVGNDPTNSVIANVGDYALSNNRYVYVKDSEINSSPTETSEWTFLLDQKGGKWLSGLAVPTDLIPATAEEGDLYLQIGTGTVYIKQGDGNWLTDGNIKGNDGDRYYSGNGDPNTNSVVGNEGNQYIDLSTGSLWTYTSGVWVFSFSMVGPVPTLGVDYQPPTAGSAGTSVAQIGIYKRHADTDGVLATPPNGSFDFSTKIVGDLVDGWSQGIPIGIEPLYASYGTASVTDIDDDSIDPSVPWADPVEIARNGVSPDANDGLSVYQAVVYKRFGSTPTEPNDIEYSFATNTFTSTLSNSWSETIPEGVNALYVSTAVFSAEGATGVDTSTWSLATLFVKDGESAKSTYSYTVYKRSVIALTSENTPSGGSFNFTTNVGSPPGTWSNAVPDSTTDPVYSSSALASIAGDEGTDISLVWSVPALISGSAGLSAYEVWLSAGNEGTLEQYLASLVGSGGETDEEFEARTQDLVEEGIKSAISRTNLGNDGEVVKYELANPLTGNTALSLRIQNTYTDMYGHSNSFSAIRSQVTNSETGLSATSTLANNAWLDANGRAGSALAILSTKVDGVEATAGAALTLESNVDGSAADATALLKVNADGVVASIKLSATSDGTVDDTAASVIKFKAGIFKFLDPNDNEYVTFDGVTGEAIFGGTILANNIVGDVTETAYFSAPRTYTGGAGNSTDTIADVSIPSQPFLRSAVFSAVPVSGDTTGVIISLYANGTYISKAHNGGSLAAGEQPSIVAYSISPNTSVNLQIRVSSSTARVGTVGGKMVLNVNKQSSSLTVNVGSLF